MNKTAGAGPDDLSNFLTSCHEAIYDFEAMFMGAAAMADPGSSLQRLLRQALEKVDALSDSIDGFSIGRTQAEASHD